MNLTTSEMTSIAIGLGICFAAFKFLHNPAIKAAALGVAGVIVAKQVPYVKDALA
jgi:hypothetical protein